MPFWTVEAHSVDAKSEGDGEERSEGVGGGPKGAWRGWRWEGERRMFSTSVLGAGGEVVVFVSVSVQEVEVEVEPRPAPRPVLDGIPALTATCVTPSACTTAGQGVKFRALSSSSSAVQGGDAKVL